MFYQFNKFLYLELLGIPELLAGEGFRIPEVDDFGKLLLKMVQCYSIKQLLTFDKK